MILGLFNCQVQMNKLNKLDTLYLIVLFVSILSIVLLMRVGDLSSDMASKRHVEIRAESVMRKIDAMNSIYMDLKSSLDLNKPQEAEK